ncbi:Fatty acyl-AMP ligase FadD28 and polyketide synthase [Mycobacteroides abscessus subsp. abscessus]|nr:Fatty acyl-AMP ligase FadD28 and polyketide synthase [Mycobacteroides abscessus subsp. abscessus]
MSTPTPVSKQSTPTDQDRLDYIDQATFLSYRANGRVQVGMALWFYEGPVDLDGLRRFNENFGKGMVARYIERSPLPFGRHRWVAASGPPRPVDVAETPCPRSGLSDWLEERAQIPIDPERGPGWHLGVQPFTDGSTAVAIVLSHCLIDGSGSVVAFMDAVLGNERDLGYERPRSRSRLQAIRSDLRQTFRDLPEVRRTVKVAAKLARERRGEMTATPPTGVSASGDELVHVPFASAIIDLDRFDARAAELGGNGHSLVAAFATRLGVRMGRQRARDGAISLMVAINDRASLEDTRANAMTFTTFTVEPDSATTDLTELRGEIRNALRRAREQPDESFQLLPLTPFIPRRAVRHTAAMVLGELPVTCSNVGDVPELVGRIDGVRQADYVICWGVEQNVKKRDIEQPGGLLVVTALRHNGKVTLGVVGYQVGAENTKAVLREHVQQTLDELGVTPLEVY